MKNRALFRVIWLALLPMFAGASWSVPQPSRVGTWNLRTPPRSAPLEIYLPDGQSPPSGEKGRPAIVYLKNLALPRIGQESDASILGDFLRDGYIVATIDFGHQPQAVAPQINLDLWLVRRLLGRLFSQEKVDQNHVYILPEGYRLARDVLYYEQGGEQFRLDLRYPSRPRQPVPLLLHISIDNALRSSNFLANWVYHDTIAECGLTRGYAMAQLDNPEKQFLGFDPMPETVYRLKAAVRTLRARSACYGLDANRFAVEGFSRSSSQAALLAMSGGIESLEGDGPYPGVSSRVQCAVLHAGRMDHAAILSSGHPLGKNYEKLWGDPVQNKSVWDAHSAISYVTPDDPPTILSVGADDDFRTQQMRLMADALERSGVPHELLVTPKMRHWVVFDPESLGRIYAFLDEHLKPPPDPSRDTEDSTRGVPGRRRARFGFLRRFR